MREAVPTPELALPAAHARAFPRLRVSTAALAAGIFAFAWIYRFNTLGGAFAGFDNDHFIYFVRAQQIVRGERPLRDFADLGLQGAWPSPTYLMPAVALRLFGETLLTEAVFSVTMVALSLTLAFVLIARVGGRLPAVVTTLLTLFVGTKLYNWPKLLVGAGATAVLMFYTARPSRTRAAVMGAWTAVGFLFRHDYAVYLGIASIVAIVASGTWASRRAVLAHGAAYGLTAALLVAGPLGWVQRYAGIESYLRTHLEISRNESRRTNLRWPKFTTAGVSPVGFFGNETNATAWLYYLCWGIPLVALAAMRNGVGVTAMDPRRARALLLSIIALALLLDQFFLRGNLTGRLGDLGAPVALLAAWLMTSSGTRWTTRSALAGACAAVILLCTASSIWTISAVAHELDTSGLSDSVGKTVRRFRSVSADLSALPPGRAAMPPADDLTAAGYLRACTDPEDRVLVMARTPELLVMANRPFAAGHPTFMTGFYTSESDQRQTIDRLTRQSVPVVVTPPAEIYERDLVPEFPLVAAYLDARYRAVGELPGPSGDQVRILVERDRPSAGTFGEADLPCYRGSRRGGGR